jgi:dihydrofolate synthase/folylpolyglutamate synthase
MSSNRAYEKLFQRTAQGIKPGLEIISDLLQALNNPHQRLAAIHVAGTNGKGSVCAMLESVLRLSGFKTGLYTSPHLMDFAERFRVNGELIPADELEGYIERLEETAERVALDSASRPATFFEISTAIAFQYFADEQVDIAIIETGMGGRWDATNVIIPLVSVITHIDVDHTDFLGDSIGQIAAEKAGILKPGRPVISAPQSEEVFAELCRPGNPIINAAEAVSVLKVGEPQKIKIETQGRSLPPVQLPLLGECQRENCAVAVAALETLADMLDFEPSIKTGLETVEWGARFQVISTDPCVILDGAHNPSAARALVKSLTENFPHHEVGFILGFLGDKDAVAFMREIKPLVGRAWAISVNAHRGAAADEVAFQARAAGFAAEPEDLPAAWISARKWAAAEPARVVCVTGTLHLPELIRGIIPPAAPECAS